jgi:hypothetical protein
MSTLPKIINTPLMVTLENSTTSEEKHSPKHNTIKTDAKEKFITQLQQCNQIFCFLILGILIIITLFLIISALTYNRYQGYIQGYEYENAYHVSRHECYRAGDVSMNVTVWCLTLYRLPWVINDTHCKPQPNEGYYSDVICPIRHLESQVHIEIAMTSTSSYYDSDWVYPNHHNHNHSQTDFNQWPFAGRNRDKPIIQVISSGNKCFNLSVTDTNTCMQNFASQPQLLQIYDCYGVSFLTLCMANDGNLSSLDNAPWWTRWFIVTPLTIILIISGIWFLIILFIWIVKCYYQVKSWCCSSSV